MNEGGLIAPLLLLYLPLIKGGSSAVNINQPARCAGCHRTHQAFAWAMGAALAFFGAFNELIDVGAERFAGEGSEPPLVMLARREL